MCAAICLALATTASAACTMATPADRQRPGPVGVHAVRGLPVSPRITVDVIDRDPRGRLAIWLHAVAWP